ncbi:MAG TPA: hypothetical protein VMU41_02640 [Candidatus Binataceae bacterium]|nr:hypothetical protein [Candidatus Binataceae bacterium]
MIGLSEIKTMVDSSPDNVSAYGRDLHGLYNYVGLSATSALTFTAILDALYGKIRDQFVSNHVTIWRHCKQLKNELIQNHIFCGETLEPYISILDRLQDAMRGPASAPLAQDGWAQAVGFASDHVKLQSWGDANRHALINARQFSVGRSALQLEQRGFEIIRDKGNLRVEPAAEARLIARLEELTKTIGGINVAANIFRLIERTYDYRQERYHLVRRVATVPTDVQPMVPYGFLLQLGAKHPTLPRSPAGIDQSWRDLAELATAYAATFDVQPYSSYELMFKDHLTLIPFLQEVALYDSLFTIPQIRPRDAIKIAGGVLDWLDHTQKQDGGWSIAEVLAVADQILKIGSQRQGPVVIGVGDLTRVCKPIPAKTIGRILERVLSHPMPGANQNFSKPYEPPGPDFPFKPLLNMGDGKYCLLNPSACTPGVIEALFTSLRKIHAGFDDRIGLAIERLLRQELTSRGVAVSSGKYGDGGQEGECDLVIETTQTIFFLEIKKKPLTRLARAGTDVDVLFDLAGSLLDAQLQAGGHEVGIKTNGHLDLIDEHGQSTRVPLNGREVERIAVSLFDFGGFQDRILLKLFLENTLNVKYGTHDPSRQKKFDALNGKIAELRDQHQKLAAMRSAPLQQPFFHCWFLSVPQFLVLLDSVKSSEDFRASLWQTRHVWTGSLDFYADLAYMRKAKMGATLNGS